jgi:hypothetical protein
MNSAPGRYRVIVVIGALFARPSEARQWLAMAVDGGKADIWPIQSVVLEVSFLN